VVCVRWFGLVSFVDACCQSRSGEVMFASSVVSQDILVFSHRHCCCFETGMDHSFNIMQLAVMHKGECLLFLF
jgi:hypothetical protein